MLSEKLWLLLDIVIFILFSAIVSIPYFLLWTYKTFVHLIARLIHPDLIPLTGADPLFSLDKFTGEESLGPISQNIGWLLRVGTPEGQALELDWIQDRFSKAFLRSSPEGTREYPNFFLYLVRFGGYAFRRPVPAIDITRQIRRTELGKGQTLEDFTSQWLGQPFTEKGPAWEVVLIAETGTAEESALIFKINHSCADGYNLIHILDTLTENQSPYLVKPFEETFFDKAKLVIQFPRIYTKHLWKVYEVTKRYPFRIPKGSQPEPDVITCISMDLPSLILIRRKTDTHFISVLASILGGVIQRILAENELKASDGPDAMQIFTSLPWPNHPRKTMCNHWTLGNFTVPLKVDNGLERLLAVEKDFLAYDAEGLNRSSKRFVINRIFGALPANALKNIFEGNPGMQTGFTALLGSRTAYKLNERSLRSIHPLIGTAFDHVAFAGFAFSNADNFDCTLTSKRNVAKLAGGTSKIKEYFVQEAESLKRIVLEQGAEVEGVK